NYAIDRPALVKPNGYLWGRPTDQILPPGLGSDAQVYPLGAVTDKSLAKARALLAKARFKPAKLILYSNHCCVEITEIFQYDMRRLGIDVEIRYFSTGTLIAKAGTRGEPFDVVGTLWGVDYPDGATFFQPLLDGTGITKTGNTDSAYFNRARYNREI